MDEVQIAKSMAEILHKLEHSGDDDNYDPTPQRRRRVSAELGREEVDWARLSGMKAELALTRARKTNRDFRTVLAETEFMVSVELARVLAATVDPVLEGLREVVVVEEEEGGGVCGVCREELEVGEEARAMDCMHKFHGVCIVKWLKLKNVCPLCVGIGQ